jgi:hypothetical protein
MLYLFVSAKVPVFLIVAIHELPSCSAARHLLYYLGPGLPGGQGRQSRSHYCKEALIMQEQNAQASGSTNLTDSTRRTITTTQDRLDTLINQVRAEIADVREPKAQALLETTAEVLLGLKKAYEEYGRGGEKAWQ